jgi:hypothetical protein
MNRKARDIATNPGTWIISIPVAIISIMMLPDPHKDIDMWERSCHNRGGVIATRKTDNHTYRYCIKSLDLIDTDD